MGMSEAGQVYNSLKDVHLAHYFSRADVLRHLVHMGLVTRTGEVVPESEWRRLYFKDQREAKEREKEEHRRRLQEAEDASKRRIKAKIRRREVRRSLRAFLENEWRRLYVLTQQQEQEQEQGAHVSTQPDAEDPSVREAQDKSRRRRRREAYLARPSSTSEPDLVHFDIEWNFRPVSVTTEGARSSSGTPGQSNGTGGVSNGTAGPSNGTSGHVNSSSGPSDSTPDWAKPQKFLQKPKFAGRRGMVGEPYVASLGPNPSPRYIHILRPTNSCREVWMRLCPPQPASSRPPRPTPKPLPQLRLVYAGGGAPCPTPTTLLLMQQPAGAHNVTVFHGVVCIGDEIEITSMRRTNFPFSLTIYENGVATGRLSACCEHRYAPGSRLGGRSGHLRVVEIVGGEPCLRKFTDVCVESMLRDTNPSYYARKLTPEFSPCTRIVFTRFEEQTFVFHCTYDEILRKRCQLRVVEKRHKSRRRVPHTKTRDVTPPDDAPPYTPPEDTGSETGTTDEASTDDKGSEDVTSDTSSGSSSRGRPASDASQETLVSEAGSKVASARSSSSHSTSSDIESVVLQDQLHVRHDEELSHERRRPVSAESCNGPSDLEVAAALGVVTRPLEQSDEKLNHREKSTPTDTSPLNTGGSSPTHTTRKDTESTITRRGRYSSSKSRSSRHSTFSSSEGKSNATNSRLSRQDSRNNRRRSFNVSSSLEGQLGGTKSRQDSIHELNSRPGSSKSRRRVGSTGSQHSRGDIWEGSDKVDSFYSQQKFTSSSGSDAHAVPGSVTDVSYGSSWEEEDEDKEDEAEDMEDTDDDDEADESEGDEGDIEEYVESSEKELSDESTNSDQDSLSSEVVNIEEDSREEEAADVDEEVDSEHAEPDKEGGSKEEVAKDVVEGKAAEVSVSEDVDEGSDIVQMSSSEAEVVEEDEEKGE